MFKGVREGGACKDQEGVTRESSQERAVQWAPRKKNVPGRKEQSAKRS